jgi:hypothetical protein
MRTVALCASGAQDHGFHFVGRVIVIVAALPQT